MDRWPPGTLAVLLMAGLSVTAWLLVQLIAYLRQNARRYFWLELFGGLLLLGLGLFSLIGYPVARWTWRLPFLAIVLAGCTSIGRAFLYVGRNVRSASKSERA